MLAADDRRRSDAAAGRQRSAARSRGGAGPPATPARNCCACCRAIRRSTIDAGDVVGVVGSPARPLPALAHLWNGTITPLAPESLGRRRRRRVSGAARQGGRRTGAGAGRRGRARHRSVGRVPAAREAEARAQLVSGNARDLPDGRRLRTDRARARRRGARAAGRQPGLLPDRDAAGAARRWSRRACSSPAPTSSSTPSPACRARARRRRSGRTSRSATAACRPTACSTTGTAPRSSRASGVQVTFTPHLVPLDRGILVDDLRPRRARHDRRGARRRPSAGLRRRARSSG